MSTLVTADLHLTDNPRDAYRWRVFTAIAHAIQDNKDLSHVVIAGDLTHHKDNHSNALINRLVDELAGLSLNAKVIILKGNHDYTDPAYPLLAMTRYLDNITHIDCPFAMSIEGKRWRFLPYTQDAEAEWVGLGKADVVCFHQPVEGAVASGGHSIAGIPAKLFKRFGAKLIIGGDIHQPQTIKGVTYVGSPHPVSAGEDHDPRFLLIKGASILKEIPVKSIKRSTIKMRRMKPLADFGIREGDQVRVKVELPTSRQDQWAEYRDKIKADAEEHGIILLGLDIVPLDQKLQLPDEHARSVTALDVFKEFIEQQQIPGDLVGVGHTLLTQAQDSA